MFTRVLGRYVASTVSLDVWEGAESVGGQLNWDEECSFSGVTSSGRVWRTVPESDDSSVYLAYTIVYTGSFCLKYAWEYFY